MSLVEVSLFFGLVSLVEVVLVWQRLGGSSRCWASLVELLGRGGGVCEYKRGNESGKGYDI